MVRKKALFCLLQPTFAHLLNANCMQIFKVGHSTVHFFDLNLKIPFVSLLNIFFPRKLRKFEFRLNIWVEISNTGGPHLVRFLGSGKNRTMRNSY